MSKPIVVFLCGGISKRMAPFGDKVLFKFLGKSLLEHQIELAQKAGFTKFVFVGSEQNIGAIKRIAEEFKIKAEFVLQKEARGMADALLSAREILDGKEIVVVSPNDIFELEAYTSLLKASAGTAVSYIIGYKVKKYFPGGYLKVDGDKLLQVIEKPGEGKEPSDMINIVLHLHKDTGTFFKILESTQSKKDDVYELALSKLCQGADVRVVPYSGSWQAIKHPWDILDAMGWFLSKIKGEKISPSAEISPKATIKGSVIIEEGVRVFEGAAISGPAYIGRNSIIGNNALVRHAHIGENCEIGFSTEVARSYIDDGTRIHGAYVGDSVIGKNCNLGAGTKTANLRFDEKPVKVGVAGLKTDTKKIKLGVLMGDNCKTGVNTNLMPGVKVGPKSFVGPGVVLAEDLPTRKAILFDKRIYKVIDNKWLGDKGGNIGG